MLKKGIRFLFLDKVILSVVHYRHMVNNMDEDCLFRCDVCGRTRRCREEDAPICCGRPMTLVMERCTSPPADAEHARGASGEPCNDGRGQ